MSDWTELRSLISTYEAPEPKSPNQRKQSFRARKSATRLRNVAVMDMETDPFDASRPDDMVLPFVAAIYSEEFETIIVWENDYDLFVSRLVDSIIAIPDNFTIYAHNGGRFDFLFLVHKLRGEISFKGRSIMRASIGSHELRDSYHLIPEKLASYKKEKFDYEKNRKWNRDKYREEIIRYLISDCEYLLKIVKDFLRRFGFKMTFGAASLSELRKHYRVESVSPMVDEKVRTFYMGGRVECLTGAGYWKGEYKLYDVNSMYPYVMAHYRHPIGSEYVFRGGRPNNYTAFLEIECRNYGALLRWDDDGNLGSGNDRERQRFRCSKFEYETALELNLIDDVEIITCVDNFEWTKFDKFILPLYAERQTVTNKMKQLKEGTQEHDDLKVENIFLKFLLNSSYGKFAQNPRRFKEYFLTDPGEKPPIDENYSAIDYEGADYWIWTKPTEKQRFLNVGTSASITGAARSVLMRAIHAAKNPMYCDTDSLICEQLRGHEIHNSKLGSWKLERTINELIVCGKKLYAYKTDGDPKPKIKSKGAANLTWDDMVAILAGQVIKSMPTGPTLTRRHSQSYLTRNIRMTTAKFPIERKA